PPRLQSMLPPSNFGAVIPGQIYRSSYPLEENFGFLKKLKLKSILTLVKETCPEPYVSFMTENGIQHFQVHIPANKGTVCMTTEQMTRALAVVLDRQNHPLLIHCNKGKHRTGCVTGCLRKVLGDNLKTVYEEYHTYADPKARIFDEHFMGSFDERTVLWLAREQGFLPP
ncbi:protein-tyrosine phosphatase, partial [Saccharata proteae CBS 121410]